MIKQDCLVTIVIPIFNAEKYIEKCLNSVISQTYENIEVYCINDGTKDNCGKILDKYAKKDSRIRALHIDNAGVSNARNVGIQNATGEFIFFLDADDFLTEDAIETLVFCQTRSQADLIVGNFVKIKDKELISSGHEETFKIETYLNKEDIYNYTKKFLRTSYKDLMFNHCWSKLYPLTIIKSNNILFNTKLDGFEDIDFNFRVLPYIESISYIPNIVYNYLLSTTSQSAQISLNPKQIEIFYIAFESIKSFLKNNNTNVKFNIDKEVGHFYISNMIMILIRTCGQTNKQNKQLAYKIIHTMLNFSMIQKHIKYYSPIGKETWLMPYLMKYKLISLTILFGKYKYHKHRTNNLLELVSKIMG